MLFNIIVKYVTFEGDFFTQHNILEIHVSCHMYHKFVPFYCRVVVHGTDVPVICFKMAYEFRMIFTFLNS